MAKRNDSDLFFTCSVIEQIGRDSLRRRSDVVILLGRKRIQRIYDFADVLHCEPIRKVSYDIMELHDIKLGDFDNVGLCRYTVPDVWTIGKVYARLIEDLSEPDNAIDILIEVYGSWMDGALSNYNSDLYYQQREYLAESYREGAPIDM